jgi:hypothetical protein
MHPTDEFLRHAAECEQMAIRCFIGIMAAPCQRVPEPSCLSLIVAIELFYFPQIGHPILD